MIGPATRRHFLKALNHAGRAELSMQPGEQIETTQRELMTAQIEVLRGIAFAFLEGEVTLREPGPSERKDS